MGVEGKGLIQPQLTTSFISRRVHTYVSPRYFSVVSRIYVLCTRIPQLGESRQKSRPWGTSPTTRVNKEGMKQCVCAFTVLLSSRGDDSAVFYEFLRRPGMIQFDPDGGTRCEMVVLTTY